jgi:uncharacterized damage-inducible protein DinB
MADRRTDARNAYESAHRELCQLVDAMSAEEMQRDSANPGWTARDIMAHMSTIDERLRSQMQAALDSKPYNTLEDVNTFNERMVAERRSWGIEKVRAELDQQREATLRLFDSASDSQLENTIDHPRRGRVNLIDLATNAGQHIRTHASEIAATRAAK